MILTAFYLLQIAFYLLQIAFSLFVIGWVAVDTLLGENS